MLKFDPPAHVGERLALHIAATTPTLDMRVERDTRRGAVLVALIVSIVVNIFFLLR